MAEFQIQEVYRLIGAGIILVGEVKSGEIRNGMKPRLDGVIMEVKSMEANRKRIVVAKTGDTLGISLVKGNYKILKKRLGSKVTFD